LAICMSPLITSKPVDRSFVAFCRT
jgi:hypothetical protein